jgi:hypothetical protein
MFRAAMGLPRDLRQTHVLAAGESVPVVIMDFGNPQCIVLGPLPPDDRFRRIGAALEQHQTFREGTNVEFAEVEAPDRVRIVIWERGVGPTSRPAPDRAALVAAAAFGGSGIADVVAPAELAGRMARRQRLPHRVGGGAVFGRMASASSSYLVAAGRFNSSSILTALHGATGGRGCARFLHNRLRSTMKELSPNDRPREKLARHGPHALGDNELVALVLGTGDRRRDALAVANQLLAERWSPRPDADDLRRAVASRRHRAARRRSVAAMEPGAAR